MNGWEERHQTNFTPFDWLTDIEMLSSSQPDPWCVCICILVINGWPKHSSCWSWENNDNCDAACYHTPNWSLSIANFWNEDVNGGGTHKRPHIERCLTSLICEVNSLKFIFFNTLNAFFRQVKKKILLCTTNKYMKMSDSCLFTNWRDKEIQLISMHQRIKLFYE